MKKILYILTITTISITSLFAQVKEKREIGGFTGISASGIIEVILKQGDEYLVEVEALPNHINNIKTELKGKTLLISTPGKWKNGDPKIFITSPRIENITSSGASKIYSKGLIEEENLTIKSSGASELKLSIKTLSTKIYPSGASNLELNGYSEDLLINASGASNIEADELVVMNAEISLSGASSSELNVSESITGTTSGASSLSVSGNTKVKSISQSGVSSINGIDKFDNEYKNSTINNYEEEEVEITNDIIGDIIVKENGDTTRISIGKKKILIIDGEDKTKIDLDIKDTSSTNSNSWNYGINGLILGVNSFLDPSNQMNVPTGYEYLETDIARSHNVQINFLDGNIKLVDKYVTLHPGLGLEFNSYEFRKDYEIQPSSTDNDEITALQKYNSDSTLVSYDKNRLKDTYLNVPLMLAFHTNKNHKKAFHLGVGGYAGLRIASKMKYKYKLDGEGTKKKIKDDYYLSSFRYGLTTSIGYSNINVFANYTLNGLFEDNKGPTLHPFTVGLMVIGF